MKTIGAPSFEQIAKNAVARRRKLAEIAAKRAQLNREIDSIESKITRLEKAERRLLELDD